MGTALLALKKGYKSLALLPIPHVFPVPFRHFCYKMEKSGAFWQVPLPAARPQMKLQQNERSKADAGMNNRHGGWGWPAPRLFWDRVHGALQCRPCRHPL